MAFFIGHLLKGSHFSTGGAQEMPVSSREIQFSENVSRPLSGSLSGGDPAPSSRGHEGQANAGGRGGRRQCSRRLRERRRGWAWSRNLWCRKSRHRSTSRLLSASVSPT